MATIAEAIFEQIWAQLVCRDAIHRQVVDEDVEHERLVWFAPIPHPSNNPVAIDFLRDLLVQWRCARSDPPGKEQQSKGDGVEGEEDARDIRQPSRSPE